MKNDIPGEELMSVFFFFLLFTTSIGAVENLDLIEVNATKEIEAFTFTQTETITSDELGSSPLPLASQVLERVPGLVSSQNGGPGARTTFFIRGTEARHVSFTLDGLKLNDPSNTDRQFDAAFLTLTSVDSIRVHKGPQAVLYGSDAMGGHIEMRTRKGSINPEKRLTLSGGSFGTAGAAYRHDWARGTLSVVRQRSDGISRFNEKRYDATERDGSEITQLTSSSAHPWSGKLQTDLLSSFIEGRNELDVTSDSSHEKGRNHQYLLQQMTSFRLSKRTAFSLRNGLNRNERAVTTDFGTNRFSGNLIQNELLWQQGNDEERIVSGVAIEEESLRLSGQRKFSLSSVFFQGLLKAGRFSLQAGIRGDHHSRYGRFVTGGAGVEMRSDSGVWSVQFARGYKSPSLYQLYGPPLVGFPSVGNRDLSPETNHSYEASWKKKLGEWELQNVTFQNRLSNLIEFDLVNGYRNQGRFIAEGVEPSFKWTRESVEVRGSFTHQRFREQERIVLRRPHNMGQLHGTIFIQDAHEVFLKGRWFDSRKDQFAGKTLKLSSFETYDIGGVYRKSQYELSLQVVNLLDRKYEEIYGFSVLPRSIFGAWSMKF